MSGWGNVLLPLALLALGSALAAGPPPLLPNAKQRSANLESSNNNRVSGDLWDNNNNEEGAGSLVRQKRYVTLNDYLIEVYLSTQHLKDSNCTEKLLNQSVSLHFCNSNKIVYSSLRVEAVSDLRIPFHNYTYELCSNVTRLSHHDTILGHDFVIYKRPTQEDMRLEVFLIFLFSPIWMDMVSYRVIPANTSGWQVLHVESKIRPLVESGVCVNMYVRETITRNGTSYNRFLNQTELEEVFMLDNLYPHELVNQPLVSTFVTFSGTISLPFSGRRSVGASSTTRCSNVTRCTLQHHSVDLDGYLPLKVVYPHEADIGRCENGPVYHHHHPNQEQETDHTVVEDEEDGSGLTSLHSGGKENSDALFECVPQKFEDFPTLVSLNRDVLALINIPDLLITGCGVQQCNTIK